MIPYNSLHHFIVIQMSDVWDLHNLLPTHIILNMKNSITNTPDVKNTSISNFYDYRSILKITIWIYLIHFVPGMPVITFRRKPCYRPPLRAKSCNQPPWARKNAIISSAVKIFRHLWRWKPPIYPKTIRNISY